MNLVERYNKKKSRNFRSKTTPSIHIKYTYSKGSINYMAMLTDSNLEWVELSKKSNEFRYYENEVLSDLGIVKT